MDDVTPPKSKNFDDVTRPGNIPAAPSSNPVIVGNQTIQTDPMMAAPRPYPAQPSIPVQPPMSTRDTPVLPANDNEVLQSDPISQEPSTPIASSLGEISLSEETTQPPSIESVHKITHDKAFYGQMKPPKSKFKKFLIFIFIVVIMAGISYGAWFLLNSNKDTTLPEPTTTTPVVEKSTVPQYVVPEGYSTYTSADNGYSFSYPKEYGEFTKNTPAQQSNEQQAPLTLQSETPSAQYGPGINGKFLIETYTSKDQVIESRKNGPMIQLKSGKWIVITANDADATKNKVGDEYLDIDKKVVSGQTNGQLEVYTLNSTDEGTTTTRLVFVRNNTLQVITLPSFSSVESQSAGTQNDKTAYDTLVKNVKDSVYIKTN